MRVVAIVIIAVLTSFTAGTTSPAAAVPKPVDGTGAERLIVGFAPDASARAITAAHTAAGSRVQRRHARLGLEIVSVAAGAAGHAIAAYEADPRVRYVERDAPVHAYGAPTDKFYGEAQWHLQPVSAANKGTANWEPVYGPGGQAQLGRGVRVAIIDTGLRTAGATDPPANVNLGLARDYVNDGDAEVADDDNGHGTHIAGTIAQATDNANGVAGIAPAAEIIPIKVLDENGGGTVSNVISAVLYAADAGAQVINLSLGGSSFSNAMCAAVKSVASRALVISASGNESTPFSPRPVSYPAACPGALSVGGLRYDGTRAPYSNTGCELTLTAPGGDATQDRFRPDGNPDGIWQETFNKIGNVYDFDIYPYDGTSMAAAHVAGAAAVLLGINGDLSKVRRVLKASARDLGDGGPDDTFGYGALDIANAVNLINGPTPAVTDRGYWLASSDGGVFNFRSCFLGSVGSITLSQPIVGIAATPTGTGYWNVARDGGIFAFGDAAFHGSTGAITLNKPIVGMASTPSGNGYWLVASDGGIFAFGDAAFYGSTGAITLNKPIVGMARTPTGGGYWLVASDGGIFAFGDAAFYGSTGAIKLNQPIVSMARTPGGAGYWLVASDGGIFAFGDAAFYGSTGAIKLNKPIVAMAATSSGGGYWMVASDGGIFAFGNAPFFGSTASLGLTQPIVGIAVAADLS